MWSQARPINGRKQIVIASMVGRIIIKIIIEEIKVDGKA